MPLKKRPYTIGGYSVHQYEFTPDAALGAAISTGDQQGNVYVSGPSDEIVKRIVSHCETAPLTTAATFEIEYASTATGNAFEDLDVISIWTPITHSTNFFVHTAGQVTVIADSGFNTTSLPSRRALRFNVNAAGGTPAQNATVIMEVWRPLQ